MHHSFVILATATPLDPEPFRRDESTIEEMPIDQLVADAILNFDDHSFDNQKFLF